MELETSDRCRGHCCASFYGLSPERCAEEARSFEALAQRRPLTPFEKNEYYQVKTIADMVVVIDEATGEMGCLHVKANGDCGIYETRPEMCRKYPNGKPCITKGCRWENGAAESVSATTQVSNRRKRLMQFDKQIAEDKLDAGEALPLGEVSDEVIEQAEGLLERAGRNVQLRKGDRREEGLLALHAKIAAVNNLAAELVGAQKEGGAWVVEEEGAAYVSNKDGLFRITIEHVAGKPTPVEVAKDKLHDIRLPGQRRLGATLRAG